MNDTLSGTVKHIIYANEKTHYTVAYIESLTQGKTCIVGSLPHLSLGEEISCNGTWKDHKDYGEQFSGVII